MFKESARQATEAFRKVFITLKYIVIMVKIDIVIHVINFKGAWQATGAFRQIFVTITYTIFNNKLDIVLYVNERAHGRLLRHFARCAPRSQDGEMGRLKEEYPE